MKYLIVGLGNIGWEYQNTRHNAGFKMVDALAQSIGAHFEENRYGAVADGRIKSAQVVLLKPNTLMNLSGHAVRYWMQIEKIPIENLLILVDDISLPFGTTRLRSQGSAGGHNGLRNIEECIGSQNYARLKFGVGNNFSQGHQIDYVLGVWDPEEEEQLDELCKTTTEIIKSFCLQGVARTMTLYNSKKPATQPSADKKNDTN